MRKAIMILMVFFVAACGKSSNDEVTASSVFYGAKDGITTVTVSKMTFLETRASIGRYQVTQAVVQKSDGAILKSDSFCGEFEALFSVYALQNQYGDKTYSWVNGFNESPYLAESQPQVAHLKDHPSSAYIETALVSEPSCL